MSWVKCFQNDIERKKTNQKRKRDFYIGFQTAHSPHFLSKMIRKKGKIFKILTFSYLRFFSLFNGTTSFFVWSESPWMGAQLRNTPLVPPISHRRAHPIFVHQYDPLATLFLTIYPLYHSPSFFKAPTMNECEEARGLRSFAFQKILIIVKNLLERS